MRRARGRWRTCERPARPRSAACRTSRRGDGDAVDAVDAVVRRRAASCAVSAVSAVSSGKAEKTAMERRLLVKSAGAVPPEVVEAVEAVRRVSRQVSAGDLMLEAPAASKNAWVAPMGHAGSHCYCQSFWRYVHAGWLGADLVHVSENDQLMSTPD